MNQIIKHLVATAAAAATTFALFSGVAALATDDKAALMAAQAKHTLLAAERPDTTISSEESTSARTISTEVG